MPPPRKSAPRSRPRPPGASKPVRRRAPKAAVNPDSVADGVRLQKVLASAGLGSRRHCEEYIVAGRVTIDGRPARELGVRVDLDRQKVCVDGEPVVAQKHVYFLINKPTGYLSTSQDPQGRPRVLDLLPNTRERLFTVGRLDESSQGLMLVTNDGELANRLAHPRFGVEKTYRVLVAGVPTPEELQTLRTGITFSDGVYRVESVHRVRKHGNSMLLEIVLKEGHNREIRRLLARTEHKVMRLERIAFGPLKLAKLPTGAYRQLTGREVAGLQELVSRPASRRKAAPRAAGGSRPRPAGAPRSPAAKPAGAPRPPRAPREMIHDE